MVDFRYPGPAGSCKRGEDMRAPLVLAEYSSKSDPNKKYKIYGAKDGTCYCDCWAWKRRRTCLHLDDFLNRVLPKAEEAHRVAKHDGDKELLLAIDKAVSSLR